MNDIKSSIFGKWSGDSEYFVPRWQSTFYRLKAAICLALNRQPTKDINFYSENIVITYINGGSYYVPGEPTVYWSECIAVGHGLFKNWWAAIYSDSN